MLREFKFLVTVERVITDDVEIHVLAKNEEDAAFVAEKALLVYPDSHDEDNIPYCYTEKRVNHTPYIVELRASLE